MTQPGSLRILIADDHAIVREGLSAVINREPDMRVVAEAGTWPEAVEQACRHTPEVAVLDLHMPGMEPADGIAALRQHCPAVEIVVFSAFGTEQDVRDVVRAGARGYVPKGESSREDLLACLRAVSGGQAWIHPLVAVTLADRMTAPSLTPRELEVLRLVAAGKSNKEIGSSLDVTEGTVKVHVNHILGKLGVAGRVEAILVAAQRGIVHLADPRSPAEPGRSSTFASPTAPPDPVK
jgi:DNA-binding NarL/FixJ family response regulator